MNLFSHVYISPVYHMAVYHLSRLLNTHSKLKVSGRGFAIILLFFFLVPKGDLQPGSSHHRRQRGSERNHRRWTDDEQARIRSPNNRDGQRAGTDKFQTEEADPPWQKEAYLTICSVFARMLIAVSVETRGLHVRSRNQSPV